MNNNLLIYKTRNDRWVARKTDWKNFYPDYVKVTHNSIEALRWFITAKWHRFVRRVRNFLKRKGVNSKMSQQMLNLAGILLILGLILAAAWAGQNDLMF